MSGAGKAVGTKAEYAAHRGCSPAYVSKLIRLGKLAEPALLPDGRVNFVLADQMVGAAGQQAGAALTLGGPNYSEERAKREAAEAELAQMRVATARRELVKVQAVEQAAASVFGRAMAAFSEAWPAVAPELAQLTDPGAIAERLAAEQRRVMATVHREFMEDAVRRSAA